jgi:TonB-dependent receptor
MQRNADDTDNKNSSLQFDLTYELDGVFFTTIKTGVRYSTKEFIRASWQNQNQQKTKITDGKTEAIDIREIFVEPGFNTSDEYIQTANDLQQCHTTRTIKIDQGGNIPNTWPTTNCDIDQITSYFDMHDIKAYSESRGAGYYELPESRYTVEEETSALYLQTDFLTEFVDLGLFGNIGVRYIETSTSSSGLIDADPGVKPIAYNTVSFAGDYQAFLPSVNANLVLNDETILRFAAYKSISRPGLAKLSPGIKLELNDELGEGIAGTAKLGNPNLEPIQATNLDLSYEWYYSDSNMLSAALFYKNLDSIIATSPIRIPLEISGELWLATQPANLPGTKIKGFEINLQHGFDHLKGLFSHTGIRANYTYTTEDSDLFDKEGDEITRKGLSENSYNLATYYDDGTLSLRLAYAWRDDFVRRENVILGFGSEYLLPEIEKARGQLDFSANYSINKHIKFNFSIINLNKSITERYLKYKPLINYISESGIRYTLGLVARF